MKAEASAVRRLILHIGTEKTGSTSIQTFLHLNRRRLAANGIGVPTTLGDPAHFHLQLMANDDDFNDDFIRNLRLHLDPALRLQTLAEWRESFYAEVINSSAHTWIISCESLHSRLLRDSELARLKRILSPLFNTFAIIVYLRDPLAHSISRLTEMAKCALPALLPEPPSSPFEFDICNHRQTVIRWQSLMAPDQFEVRLFEREALVGGDVVLDFMAVCKLEPSHYRLPGEQNPSLSATGLALMEEINRYIPRRWLDGTLIESRWVLVCHLLKHMRGGPNFQPSIEEIEVYRQHYAASNEWVRQHFFPDRPHLFKPYCLAESKEVVAKLDPADLGRVGRLIADLWLTKVAQIKQLQAQVAYLQARLDRIESDQTDIGIKAPSPHWQDFIER